MYYMHLSNIMKDMIYKIRIRLWINFLESSLMNNKILFISKEKPKKIEYLGKS